MATARSNALLGLLDSESEDDLGVRVGAKKTGGSMAPTKKGRPAAANKVTKPAQKGRRQSSGRVVKATEPTGSRKALADKTNEQNELPAKRGRKPAEVDENLVKPKATRGRPRIIKAEIQVAEREELDSPEPVKPAAKRGRKPAATKIAAAKLAEASDTNDETEIPETQQPAEAMDVDETDDCEMEESRLAEPASAQKPAESNQGGSALHRRLNEQNIKYESLELKYRNLREVGIKEADRKFDELRKANDEQSKCW